MVPRNQIFACVIKQYGTGLYRACVSFNKGHPIFIGVHPDEESADETIERFQEACSEGLIRTAEDVSRFINSLDRREPAVAGFCLFENELSLAA
jgi:hypothetical protein